MPTLAATTSNLTLIADEKSGDSFLVDHRLTDRLKEISKKPSSGASLKTYEWKYQSHTVASKLAHEVRNPLTNIYLALELLQSEADKGDLTMYFDIISRNTNRISSLITDMLNSSSTRPEQRRKCSINHLLDEALEMANDRILLKMIRVEKFYRQDLSEIMIAESEIKIAFLNIIINAIEAMPASKGKLKMTTSSNKGRCTVTIEDNGIGISPGNIGRLFDPYFTTKPDGIGLGLATTQCILQSQQATMQVESEEGKGTRFIISFNED